MDERQKQLAKEQIMELIELHKMSRRDLLRIIADLVD